jgi:dienelactone hydrolase
VPLSTGPDHDRKFYAAKLAEVFRTPLYACSLKNVSGVPDFALTRLKGGSMELQQAPAYPEDRAMPYPGQRHAFSRHNGKHYNAAAAHLANGRTSEFLHQQLR